MKNISDKNFCFNADRFEELKRIVDCRYGTIEVKYENKTLVYNNCINIIEENLDEDFRYFILNYGNY